MLTRSFKQILTDLEPVDDLDSLDLFIEGKKVATIPNAERKKGSLAVYAHLVGHKEGVIDAKRAVYGLELFAEHIPDAQANPGKHPNIDRLLDIITEGHEVEVRVNYRNP